MFGSITGTDRVRCQQDANTARGAAFQAHAVGPVHPIYHRSRLLGQGGVVTAVEPRPWIGRPLACDRTRCTTDVGPGTLNGSSGSRLCGNAFGLR